MYWITRIQFSAGAVIFLLEPSIHTYHGLFSRGKVAKAWSWPSPPPNTRVKECSSFFFPEFSWSDAKRGDKVLSILWYIRGCMSPLPVICLLLTAGNLCGMCGWRYVRSGFLFVFQFLLACYCCQFLHVTCTPEVWSKSKKEPEILRCDSLDLAVFWYEDGLKASQVPLCTQTKGRA